MRPIYRDTIIIRTLENKSNVNNNFLLNEKFLLRLPVKGFVATKLQTKQNEAKALSLVQSESFAPKLVKGTPFLRQLFYKH